MKSIFKTSFFLYTISTCMESAFNVRYFKLNNNVEVSFCYFKQTLFNVNHNIDNVSHNIEIEL